MGRDKENNERSRRIQQPRDLGSVRKGFYTLESLEKRVPTRQKGGTHVECGPHVFHLEPLFFKNGFLNPQIFKLRKYPYRVSIGNPIKFIIFRRKPLNVVYLCKLLNKNLLR